MLYEFSVTFSTQIIDHVKVNGNVENIGSTREWQDHDIEFTVTHVDFYPCIYYPFLNVFYWDSAC